VPRKPKSPQPDRPLYRQKLPAKKTALPADDFIHATPLATVPFELREDGSIVAPPPAAGHPRPVGRGEGRGEGNPPQLVFHSDTPFVRLYHGNSLELLDAIAAKYPEGRFDAIFADPPYFLSNGGITCHAGKMVSVHKGDWDQSGGAEVNHEFNREWLRRCQRVLKPNDTIWITGNEGDLVLNPFLGGGTTAVAAMRLKRGCVGIELDEHHASLAGKRADDPQTSLPSTRTSMRETQTSMADTRTSVCHA
jgi:hypothetical protein